MELKPCPFCGALLEKYHTKYKAINGSYVEYDCYMHPINECILADRVSGMGTLAENEVEKWNERVKE